MLENKMHIDKTFDELLEQLVDQIKVNDTFIELLDATQKVKNDSNLENNNNSDITKESSSQVSPKEQWINRMDFLCNENMIRLKKAQTMFRLLLSDLEKEILRKVKFDAKNNSWDL